EGGGRASLALDLLDSIRALPKRAVVVAGPRYGGDRLFTEGVCRRGFHWVVELPRRAVIATEMHPRGVPVTELFVSAKWKSHDIVSPTRGNIVTYSLAHLGYVFLADGVRGQLFAAQTGAID